MRAPSSSRRRPLCRPVACLLLVLLAAGFAVPAGAGSTAASAEPAYHLKPGSIARSRIVALGRDLVVDGEVQGHAVALSGSARISGRVAGDVIVLDGDVLLSSTARIGGDVYVLGGRLEAADGAAIDGRSVVYPEASALWVTLIQGPSLGLPTASPVVLGAKLGLLAFWLLVVALLMSVARREILTTSEGVRYEPFRNFLVGLTGVLSMVLTALFFSAFTGAFLAVPLLILVAVVALVLRFWGMVAVFHALGEWLCRRLRLRPPLPVTTASCGLLVLGALKLFPIVGIWSWTIATFIGVGAALSTRLGRQNVWLGL